MTPEIFNNLKTRPVITTHAESFQVQGQFIIKRETEKGITHEFLSYNFNVLCLDRVVPQLESILEHYKLKEHLA